MNFQMNRWFAWAGEPGGSRNGASRAGNCLPGPGRCRNARSEETATVTDASRETYQRVDYRTHGDRTSRGRIAHTPLSVSSCTGPIIRCTRSSTI